ncbi:MAG: pyridoxal phosphate-dependent decarboxylase family protein [Solirubrobacteraceae bacterium]
MDSRDLLTAAAGHAADFLAGLPERRVGPAETDPAALRAALGGPLPDGPEDPRAVLDALVAGADAGLMASQSPRFFGFVFGGSLPAALAADWVASAWDQNAVLYVAAPAAAVAEEVVGGWLAELLHLPRTASFAITTGCQMAHATGLGAARHHVLEQAGWDVEARGLTGAPAIRLLANGDFHVTLGRAVRLLGLGTDSIVRIETDDEGSMRPEALRVALAAADGPAIVCAQAGEVNSGAFDPFDAVCDIAHEHGAWVHVDGAFGLWAGAAPSHRHLVAGVGRADSWATDAHKWLNVPYDAGLAFVAHPQPHHAAFSASAAYLPAGARDAMDWTPDSSRRARSFAIWAALRSLGRDGVAELVQRCCACARRFAEILGAEEGVEVLNEVVLNQVLVRFGDDDAATDAVVAAVQAEGTCWMGPTMWRGRRAMRISVSHWATTFSDVDRSCAAILAAARAPLARLRSR